MSNRRRTESTRTTALRPPDRGRTLALRPAELNALVQASAACGGDADPDRPTVELLPLDPAAPDPPAPTPVPIFPRGSAPVRNARGTRRSRELLRVEDLKPDGDGGTGRRRRPTR